jgi:formylglycine-generating enzyme required for sulfatase activity
MNKAYPVHIPCATLVGRGDLLRCLNYYSANELAEAGTLCGFFVQEEKPQPEKETFIPVMPGEYKALAPVEIVQPESMIQFLRVKKQILIKEDEQGVNIPDWAQLPDPYTDDELRSDKSVKELKPIPLSPWRREWPFLRAACGKKRETSAIDYDRLIRIIASRKALRKIPCRKKLGWTHSCQMLLDFDFRLYPFWGDMRRIAGELTAIRHKSGLQTLVLDSYRMTDCHDFFDRKQRSFPYTLPEQGSAVIVLSDLGLYADDDVLKQKWALLGKRLGKRGIKPVALLPCPPRIWNDEICKYWHPVYWDRGVRLPDSESKITTAIKVPPQQTDSVNCAEELLAALSPSVLVEPALMRAVRVRLPGKRMDVGVEGEVWNHRHVKSCTLGFAIESSQRERLQERFSLLSQSTQTSVFDQIEQHHAYLPKVIRFEERLNQQFLIAGEAQSTEDFLKKLFDALESSEFEEQDGLSQYLHRMFERLDDERWTENDKAVSLWLKLNRENIGQGKNILLPGKIDLGRFQWLFSKYRQMTRNLLMQQGIDLRIDTPKNAKKGRNGFPEGFPLVFFETILPTVQLVTDDGACRRISVDQPSSLVAIPEDKQFTLITGSREILLDKITKPSWAEGIGREQEDLYLILPDKRTLHWFNPGRYLLKRLGAVIDIENGFWWDEAGFSDWQQNSFGSLDWADDAGIDKYGVYADFSVGQVKQRMRWIWPGTFLMGAPESETQRTYDEKQHEATITEGFWLAETACTQALWQEIMGENPSRLKGENLPVESVSWKECRQFIQTINEQRPGLDLRLPREAEWEYACRAKTETPFSFGENITTGQVNYDGEHPYNNAEKGEYRGKSVAVKSLPCNNWGLYEMHGNVWEWCNDWYAEYPSATMIDPNGPDTGTSRVLRGGSWFSFAGGCRSAYRRSRDPGYRVDDFGFRLARGQQKTGNR